MTAPASDELEVYYAPARNSIVDLVGPDGNGVYCESYDSLLREDPDLVRLPMAEARSRYNEGFRRPPREASSEEYDKMLNILPPLRRSNGVFVMRELVAGDIATIYCRIDNRYFEMRDYKDLPSEQIVQACQALL